MGLLVFLIAGVVLIHLGLQRSARKSWDHVAEVERQMAAHRERCLQIRAILTRNAPPPLILPPDCKR